MTIDDFIEAADTYGRLRKPFVFVIDFEMKNPFICSLDEAAELGVFYNFNGRTNLHADLPFPEDRIINKKNPVEFHDYVRSFSYVMENLNKGNTYLLNLTFPTEIETDYDLSSIYAVSRARYRLLFRDSFVLFSPESFIRICSDRISSFPMKGTIDASVEDAEKRILDDEKEFWEHNTIVDLIRNDISITATDVEVKRFRYIDRIVTPEKELLQVSSEISARLEPGWQDRAGSLLCSLLPAGSISGAPKKKTVEIIEEAENGPRGYYTGVSGIFTGDSLDSAVNIRFIERKGDRLFFRSGGGITANSSCEAEYREMLDKVNVPAT